MEISVSFAALSGQDEESAPEDPLFDMASDPGLADARLAGDRRNSAHARARGLQSALEGCDLLVSTDQDRARKGTVTLHSGW